MPNVAVLDARDLELDRRALAERHNDGIERLAQLGQPEFPVPASGPLPSDQGLVTIARDEFSPELLRAAILRHGCLLIRGLIDRDDALRLARGIEEAFVARNHLAAGTTSAQGYYEEFEPHSPHQVAEREWVEMGGGVLAVDSPRLIAAMFEALENVGFIDVVHRYLGEKAMISAQKTTLRKAEPQVRGAWHQDGKFLGPIRALNLWLCLSRCGDEAPGLDLVPARIDHILEAGTDSPFPIEISPALVEEVAGERGILRPIFHPGDALLFDELFLHQTGSDPEMPKPRYAVESWFFGPSAFPKGYVPLAV